ncbi:DUF483 domain-containing protein [Candidatus Woesearchaeota archaeon]|nr:DUF483 domain-containing protein [Candidatus Woesearchaeota archaeon]
MRLGELRAVFGSRIKALEIFFLMYGLKPVVRQGFYDNEIGRVKEFCRSKGLAWEIAPYKVVLADPDSKFSNKGFKARIDDPRRGMYFVYISKDERKATEAKIYEMKNDHRRLGEALGYPDCCVEFFVKNEPERRRLDNNYVIPALRNSQGVRFPYYTNVCKRHKDAAFLSHFPHSFECTASIEMAKKCFKMLSELEPDTAMMLVRELKGRVRIGSREIEFY